MTTTADSAPPSRERAYVLHPDRKEQGRRDPDRALGEAVGLAEALGALDIAGAEIVPLPKPRAGTLFGEGKVAELKLRFEALGVKVVIVDAAVTPVQQRNLEKAWQVKVLDRTALILEIFGDRARTREGVLQVDLAHLSYQKGRLVRSWTHLERQRGGRGFLGGPGETQIEADRRAIDEQIVRLRRQLEEVRKTRALHRAARQRRAYPTVALVGYTNAGKSTLFNRLTGASVMAVDMLFATLDPTMRALRLPSGRTAILSDTVGFISALPPQLVAAFRATLEEVLEADLVIHVRDIAHPQSEEQRASVIAVLEDLKMDAARLAGIIEFRNKIDLLPPTVRAGLSEAPGVVSGSAATGEGVAALIALIDSRLAEDRQDEDLHLGFADGAARAWLHRQRLVREETQDESGFTLSVRWTEAERTQFCKSFQGPGGRLLQINRCLPVHRI